MIIETWHECGGMPVCEVSNQPDCIEDYLDFLEFTNQREDLLHEIELLASKNEEYLKYLKVQYGYEIHEDPDIEFDDLQNEHHKLNPDEF